MDALEELRRAVREGRYELTLHAIDEAANDDLHVVDLESAVLTGSLLRTEDDSACGPKYVIEGMAADLSTPVGVVSRFQIDRSIL